MPPTGFVFDTFHDFPALLMDGSIVADIVPLGDGRFRLHEPDPLSAALPRAG